jgi:hypothetical protein
MGEVIFLGIVAIIAAIMLVLTATFPVSIIDHSGGPSLFPRLVIGLLFLFIIIRIIEILKTKKETRKPFVFTEIFKGPRLLFIIISIVAFILVSRLGFIITMSLYVPGMMIFFTYLNKKELPSKKEIIIMIFSCILFVVLFDYLFCTHLHVILPKGILGW